MNKLGNSMKELPWNYSHWPRPTIKPFVFLLSKNPQQKRQVRLSNLPLKEITEQNAKYKAWNNTSNIWLKNRQLLRKSSRSMTFLLPKQKNKRSIWWKLSSTIHLSENISTMFCSNSTLIQWKIRKIEANDSFWVNLLCSQSAVIFCMTNYYKLQIEWKSKNLCRLSRTQSSKNTSVITTAKSKILSSSKPLTIAKTDSSSPPLIQSSSILSRPLTKTKKDNHSSPHFQDRKVSQR